MFVIPAKAGIQFVKCSSKKRKNFLDPASATLSPQVPVSLRPAGLRQDDETKENEFQLPFLGLITSFKF